MASNDMFNLNDPNDISRAHAILLDDSEDEDNCTSGTSNKNPIYTRVLINFVIQKT